MDSHKKFLYSFSSYTMVACAASTREVIAICDSFVMMASQNSKFVSKLADFCEDVCNACAKEYKAHQIV